MTEKCQIDNKTHFEEKIDYTVFCATCSCHVKIYKYRSCEARLNALEAEGEDVYREIREAEKMAAAQTGKVNTSLLVPSPASKKATATATKDSKKFSRRGR